MILTIKKNQKASDKTVSDHKEAVFIYVGPTNNFISRYTSYKNGFPVHLTEHFENLPILKSLFVSPNEFRAFEQNVNQPGTVEKILFEKAKEYFGKAVKA